MAKPAVATLYALEQCTREVEAESSHTGKQARIKKFLETLGKDVQQTYLAIKLLLPLKNIDMRVYNIKDKRLVQLLARLTDADPDEIQKDVDEGGDISLTAKKFFAKSGNACKRSTLTLAETDAFLDSLNGQTTEDAQFDRLESFARRCTPDDVKVLVRCITKDARIGAGSRNVLSALHPDAAAAFASSSNLRAVVDMALQGSLPDSQGQDGGGDEDEEDGDGGKGSTPQKAAPKTKGKATFSLQAAPMACVKPMLAAPAKDLDELMTKRNREGAFVEIKYDGERLQVHKKGNEYKFFSRSGKAFDPSKIADVEPEIRKAVAASKSCIIDGEVLAYDTKEKKFLPFGSANKHKKKDYPNAVVCFVAFDILYHDGESLLGCPIRDRRKRLVSAVHESPPNIVLSEMFEIGNSDKDKLEELFAKSIADGEEGLMFKPLESVYEPNKRHWYKLKKDHFEGMSDTVDLVCLGANYGTGAKGGLLSVFLMGAWDAADRVWKTVCKVGNGFDDATIARLQKELKASGLLRPTSEAGIPANVSINSGEKPDFIAPDPKKMPVWEIKGFEMTGSKSHTAGFSVRFPRIFRERADKDWTTANDIKHLRNLMDTAKARAAASVGTSKAKATPTKKRAAGGAMKAAGGPKRRKKGKDSDEEEEAEAEDEEEAEAEDEEEEESDEDGGGFEIYTAKGKVGTVKKGELKKKAPPPKPAGGWQDAIKLRGKKKKKDDEEDDEDEDEEEEKGKKAKKGRAPADDSQRTESEGSEGEAKGGGSPAAAMPPAGMTACKYGAGCYRKNADHLRDFWHPPKKA